MHAYCHLFYVIQQYAKTRQKLKSMNYARSLRCYLDLKINARNSSYFPCNCLSYDVLHVIVLINIMSKMLKKYNQNARIH